MTLLKGQSDVSAVIPMPTERVDDTSVSNDVAAETLTWFFVSSSAWASATNEAAGTLVTGALTYSGILNTMNTAIGTANDTSVVFAAATRFDVLKTIPDKVLSAMAEMTPTEQKAEALKWLTTNGWYAIDHRRGQIWGRAKATVANDTVAYSYATSLSGGGAGDKVDIIKYGGTTTSLGQKTMAASMPVVLASDQAAIPVTFSTTVLKTNATGAGAINTTTAVAAEFRLVQVTCHFSAAPTTSENFVIKLDSSLGAAYDTTLFTQNPSLSAATDLVFIPDDSLDFFVGDEIVVTFTNTDARTYGLTIYYETI